MIRILHFILIYTCVCGIDPTNAIDVDGNSQVETSRELEEAQATRIDGGEIAESGRYPYMVSLLASGLYCGGTLVDKDWVLSSARCSRPNQVAIGRTIRGFDSQNDEVIDVEYVVIHPEYQNPLPNDYDYMMIKLKTSSTGTPVKLDDGSADISVGVDVTTMGWGYKRQQGFLTTYPLFLREVGLQIYDRLKCDTLYQGDVTNQMICAGAFRKGFCSGDNGGPLIIKGSSASEDVQVGITSHEEGCDGNSPKPGVFSNIGDGYDFITSTIANPPGPEVDKFPEDGFDYSNCAVESPDFIGDGRCDSYFSYNTSECNFDGGDCVCPDDGFDYSGCGNDIECTFVGDGFCNIFVDTPECNYDGGDCLCNFPRDDFDYSNCTQASPCRIGDFTCHDEFNIPECNYDGGDCESSNCFFPEDDEFDYSGCNVEYPCWIGDGFCDLDAYNTTECNGDGGDCKACDFPNDGFDYSGCNVENKCFVGDNSCLGGSYNTSECNYEGGDCVGDCYSFPDDGFDYSECLVMEKCWIGDGQCEFDELGIYSSAKCNYDGGDCGFFLRIFRMIDRLCE